MRELIQIILMILIALSAWVLIGYGRFCVFRELHPTAPVWMFFLK